MKNYIDEAKEAGLKWIKKINKDYSLYLFPCGCKSPRQMSGVRRKKLIYQVCENCEKKELEAEYSEQAQAIGIKLIGKTGNRRTRLYEFPCSHTEEKSVKNIKEGSYRCTQCLLERYINIGLKKGVTPIAPIPGGDYWWWEYINCGHKRKIQPMNVIHGDIVCKQCILNKHNGEALAAGLELLGNTSDNKHGVSFRKYRVKSCGHVQVFAICSIRNGSWRCNICLKNKLKNEAKEKGLKLFKESNRHGYEFYKFIKCGHKQEIHSSQIRHSLFITCRKCNENNWTRPNYLYLIEIQANSKKWLKLGHSAHIESRTQQYGLPIGYKCNVLFKKKYATRMIANTKESVIHKTFTKNQLDPNIMRTYHSRNGFTECYPVSVKDSLLSILRII